MVMDSGATPKRRLDSGMSSGISPSSLSAGGGGAWVSRQSGSGATIWAWMAQAASAHARTINLGRIFVFLGRLEARLRIGFERGARWQFEGGTRPGLHALIVVVAPAHPAAQIAVAVVVARQVAS